MKIKKYIKFIILFSSLTAFLLAIINKITLSLASRKNLYKNRKGQYYSWRFGDIFYTKNGSGSPILLIHDLDCSLSETEWRKLKSDLSNHYTVYTLDLLGCGLSDKPYLTYTNYLYVQLISDFIKNIIQHKSHVIASGSSCSFVTLACYNEADLFHKIMFINPENINKLNQIPNKKQKCLKIFIDTPIIGTLTYNILFRKEKVKEKLLEQYFDTKFLTTSTIDETFESAHLKSGNSKYLFASIKSNYTNANIVHALKQINNSICILGGTDEYGIQTTIVQYLSCNSAIESVLLPNCKHFPHIESPEEILEQIRIFFYIL